MRRLTLLLTMMALALLLSASVALALAVDCTADRGCFGTDDPDTLNGSVGNDDMDARQAGDRLFGGDGHDWMSGDAYGPTDTSTDGDDRVIGEAGSDGMVGYGGSDVLSGGDGRDYAYAVESSKNPGEDTVRGGADNDFIDAIDKTKDTIDCGTGTKDRVYYDKDLDTVERCEVARTKYPEELFRVASVAGEVNASRAR
ncbi:MAG TPA: hypothetical protein VFI90_10375 [Rubrobacter sp.]|nr:hypothetical protein [Rubrobacter sp.]